MCVGGQRIGGVCSEVGGESGVEPGCRPRKDENYWAAPEAVAGSNSSDGGRGLGIERTTLSAAFTLQSMSGLSRDACGGTARPEWHPTRRTKTGAKASKTL